MGIPITLLNYVSSDSVLGILWYISIIKQIVIIHYCLMTLNLVQGGFRYNFRIKDHGHLCWNKSLFQKHLH